MVAGSGTLTWDMTAANLLEDGDRVLVLSTGVFGLCTFCTCDLT